MKQVVPKQFTKEKLSFAELQEAFAQQEKSKSSGGGGGKFKNKQPAPIQITAEQILKEALNTIETEAPKPDLKIADIEELKEFQQRTRKGFEDKCRVNKILTGNWLRYAKFEEGQKEFERARSIYERYLDIDYKSPSVWLQYVEMEMKHKFINHARNIWDRAVQLLPRIDQLWYKYAHMEEMLGNVPGARSVYGRWMEWQPDAAAWRMYIKMEVRYGEVHLARKILEKFVRIHPVVESWIYYARFEERQGEIERAREIFERSAEENSKKQNEEKLLIEFAKFEERNGEIDRARVIYKYALDNLPKDMAQDLFKRFTEFEKQYGDRQAIEDVIHGKKRFEYEEELNHSASNYDIWFDYIRLEEGDQNKVMEIYERAISNTPPIQEKKYWRRYIYLWINYAVHTELIKEIEKTRNVYKTCLSIIPHKIFSFSKIWIMYAQFELRQKNIDSMRKILGTALGTCPRDKLFRTYINLEYSLGNVERVRVLYQKYLEFNPNGCSIWKDFATFESRLSEVDRARSIYEVAIKQPELDTPEVIWKNYIDFEVANKEYDFARKLYERLLERTKHVKVWGSFATFEANSGDLERARKVFQRAYDYFKNGNMEQDENDVEKKEQRLMLLESWKEFESLHGTPESVETIVKKFPKRIKKRRPIETGDSKGYLWEEYYDYIFPDDEKGQDKSKLKILDLAHQWKKKKVENPDKKE
jgi:crooked neck